MNNKISLLFPFIFFLLFFSTPKSRAQLTTGIIYTQSCAGEDNNCVNIKLNPFYFYEVQSEYEVYVKKESHGDAPEYYEELILPLGQARQLCGLKAGNYTITVYTNGDCKEDFEMQVGNSSIENFTLFPVRPNCILEALHIDNSLNYGQAEWIYTTPEIANLLSINNGEDYIPDPLKWAPGLYRVFFRDGCNGYKVGSHELTCNIEADVRSKNETPPSSCSSQDGSLRIRNIDICTATNGETSLQLVSSAGQVFTPNQWSTFTNLGSDLFTLVVEDEFGCSAEVETFDFRVEASDIEVDIEVFDACFASANGRVEIWVGSENQNYTYTSSFPNLVIEEQGPLGILYAANNIASNSTYQFEISTIEGCNFSYPITIGERAENQSWRGSVRTDVTHGCTTGALGSVNLSLGSISLPATVSWDGGPQLPINSASVAKGSLTTGEHCVEITSYCGVTTSRCFNVFNYEDDLKYLLRANSNCYTEFSFDLQNPLTQLISSFTLKGETYTDIYTTVTPWIREYNELTVRFKNSDCVINKTFYLTGAYPEVEEELPCEGFEDGKITFKFTRISEEVPEFTFDGNAISLDPSLENYVVSFDGLTAPATYNYSLISGDCSIEDGILFRGSGITTEATGHSVENRTCQYDVYCQGELLEGRTWTGEMSNRVIDRSSRSTCKTMFTCNGEDVESQKVKLVTVSVGVYNELLSLALASGIHLPRYFPGQNRYSTGSMNTCSRVRYCPADMQIKHKYFTGTTGYDPYTGLGIVTTDPTNGCLTQRCLTFTDENICPGSIGYAPEGTSNPGGNTGYDQGPCTEVRISLKALALWHSQLLLERPDYDSDPFGNNLYRLATSIFTDLGSNATYVQPGGNSGINIQDPLYCSEVLFCRETLEVLYYDDWTDPTICNPPQYPFDFCSTHVNSDLSSCEGQDGGYVNITYSCHDPMEVIDPLDPSRFEIIHNPVYYSMSGCYPEEIFNLELYPRLSPPDKSEYYILRPYFAERSHKSFVTTIDQNGFKWAPKQFSDFGGYTSYSHNATNESESDLEFIPGTLAGSEHLTADDGFVLSLHENEASEGFYLLKDNQDSADPLLTFEGNFIAYEAISDGFVLLSAEGNGPSGYENLTLHRVSFTFGDSFTYDQQDLSVSEVLSGKLHLSDGDVIAILTTKDQTYTVSSSSASLGQTIGNATKGYDERILAFTQNPNVSIAVDTSEQSLRVLRFLDSTTPQFLVHGENSSIHPLSNKNGVSSFLISGSGSISLYNSPDEIVALDDFRVYEVVLTDTDVNSVLPISDLKGAQLREVYHVENDLFTAAIDIEGDQQGKYFDKGVINNSPFVQSVTIDFLAGVSDTDALNNRSSTFEEKPKGILEEKDRFEWSIAPNPASQYLNVRLQGAGVSEGDVKLSIISSTGQRFINQIVRLNSSNSKSIQVDISMLPPGTYIAELISPHSENTHKQFMIHR